MGSIILLFTGVVLITTPIYSIIEYTYVDPTGANHTRKITNFSTQIAIRKQIQVGSKIAIKYLAENPDESVIVL